MHILFESHPKIKGCMNTMTKKERSTVDFSKWELNSAGYVHSVETTMPDYSFEDKLLWEDSEKQNSIETSGMLPLEIQEWFDENVKGLWFYEVRFGTNKAERMFYKKMVFTFHFEKTEDAAIFKLKWC
jgi:hypothetical protein